MCLDTKENYQLHRPIKNGYLNVFPGQSAILCVEMLEAIISKCLVQRLKIPRENFKHFNCVMTVPDLLNKREVKHYLNLLLGRLNFKSCFLHQESVLVTFGYALQNALVVDVGS